MVDATYDLPFAVRWPRRRSQAGENRLDFCALQMDQLASMSAPGQKHGEKTPKVNHCCLFHRNNLNVCCRNVSMAAEAHRETIPGRPTIRDCEPTITVATINVFPQFRKFPQIARRGFDCGFRSDVGFGSRNAARGSPFLGVRTYANAFI
jgi:hypothetical protein